MSRTAYRLVLLVLLLGALYWAMLTATDWWPRLRRAGRTVANTTLGDLAGLAWPVLLAAGLVALCVYIVWRLPVPRLRLGLRFGRSRGRGRRRR